LVELDDRRSLRVRFGASAYEALSGAAWHAHRAGSNIVGTDDLIRYLLAVRTPDVRRVLGQIPELTRPVSYLSRSSVAGDGEQPPRPRPDCSSEVEATLRELTWRTVRLDRLPGANRPYWTNGLRVVLHEALAQAHSAGLAYTNATHLIFSALSDPANRAVRLFPHSYQQITAQLHESPMLEQDGTPYPDMDYVAGHLRPDSTQRRRRRLARWVLGRLARLSRRGLLLAEVEREQRRQAVRMAHNTITVGHMLLAIINVDQRIAAFSLRLPDALAARNTAARRLHRCGLTFDRVHAYAVRMGDNVELAAPESLISRLDNSRWGDPLWSRAVAAGQGAATDIALTYRHPDAGTTHLLAGLLIQARSELTQLFADFGADPAELDSQIQHDLATIEPAWSA
jgi:ATP-dependent Clp protease ATP-binding subunit ClpA